MWTFWPAVVVAFLASFSFGHEQVRAGCNGTHAIGLVCETPLLNLRTFTGKSERLLNATDVRGAAIEHFNWVEQKVDDRGKVTEESTYPFSLGIVEYDDQGRRWAPEQVDAV